jgi:hypothetical protein
MTYLSMSSLNDPIIDELQNDEGNVFIGRAAAHGWLKPERVTLLTPDNSLLRALPERPPKPA